MSFTTLDDVALYLNKLSSVDFTELETAQLSALIRQVEGLIQNYCGWKILSTTYTAKKFNGTGTSIINLESFPLTAVTSVLMDGDDITSIVDQTNSDGCLVTNDDSTFTSGTDNVVVTYTAGFLPGSIPADLVYAATYMVILNYNKINTDMFGVAKGRFNDTEVTFENTNLPTLVQNVLDQYRLVIIR